MPIKIQDFKNKIIGKIQEKFEVKEQKSHHILYEIYYKNKRVLKTFCSHSSSGKDIRNDILSNRLGWKNVYLAIRPRGS